MGLLEQGPRHGAGRRLIPRTFWGAVALAALLPATVAADSGHPAAPRTPRAAAADPVARVIVKVRADSAWAKTAQGVRAGGPRQAAALGPRIGWALTDGRVIGSRTQSVHAAGIAPAELAKRLSALPEVEWAVVAERRTIYANPPNDPYFLAGPGPLTPGQWFLRAPDSERVSATDALGAWSIKTGVPSVTVAVLDTGVRFSHPDLAGKLYSGYDFISRTSNAVDGDGADADASDPGDACNGDSSSWHGTQVAGLIAAATDNGFGVAGIGRDVMLLPVRVLGRCGGYDDDILAAMKWAAGLINSPAPNPHPARVINMSLGSAGDCNPPAPTPSPYREAIAELSAAGVTVVVAAGNGTGHAVGLPANCPGAIAVAGVRHAGTKVGYSNLGPEVALAAPAGNCVLITSGWPCLYPLVTTVNDGTSAPGSNSFSDATNPTLGTSFSAPLVAGVAALMLSADPTLTPDRVKTLLTSTTRRFPTTGSADPAVGVCQPPGNFDQLECYCTTSTCGAGLLDAAAAVAEAAGRTIAPAAVFVASDTRPTPGSTVALDASPSRGRALGYQWAITAGGAFAHFVGGTTGAQAALQQTAAGVVTVALTVTDGNGLASTTTKTLGVDLPSVAINAAATTVEAGKTLAFDSVATAAAGRSIIAYHWEVSSGDALASFASGAFGANATLSALAAGTVTVKFTAADSAGDTASTTTTVTVTPAPVVVTSGSSGGGGGTFGPAALAGLLAATLLLLRRQR